MLNFRRWLIRRRVIKRIQFFLRDYIKDKNIFEIVEGIKLCFIISDNLYLKEEDGKDLLVIEDFKNFQEIEDVLPYLKRMLVEEGYRIHNIKNTIDFNVSYC